MSNLLKGSIIGAIAVTAIGAIAGYRMLDATEYAEVVSAKPIMATVTVPREACRDELVEVINPTRDPKQIGGTVAGAVIGGVLGSEVGGGSGKKVATAVGAAAGGYAGNKVQEKMQQGNTHEETQRACNTVSDTRRELQGYDVTYRLGGQEHTVRLDYDPGARIALENGQPLLNP